MALQRQKQARKPRAYGRRAGHVAEQGDLTEVVPVLSYYYFLFLSSGAACRHAYLAAHDDIKLVTGIAFPKDGPIRWDTFGDKGTGNLLKQ